jgi:hypothetical protein
VKIGILVKNGDIMDVAGQALEALRRALVDVPGTRLDPVRREPEGEGLGLLFRLELPAGAQTLAVEVLGSGEPKGVREALDRIYRQQVRLPEARFVLVAPYVSERAADLCSEQGVSYADLSGNCRLLLDQVFVRREGAPNAYADGIGIGILVPDDQAQIAVIIHDEFSFLLPLAGGPGKTIQNIHVRNCQPGAGFKNLC